MAINISFGNTYGSHDGTSLVERFLNDIADMWKNVICIGSGNEGASAGHVSGKVRRQISETVELAVQQREPALSIQIWKSYVDEMGVSVISPSGRQAGPFYEFLGAQRYILGRYRTFDLLWRTEAVQRETGDLSVASSRKTVYRKRRVENCFNSRPYCGRGVSNVASDTDVIKYGDSVFTAEQYVDIDDSIYGVACCYRGGI